MNNRLQGLDNWIFHPSLNNPLAQGMGEHKLPNMDTNSTDALPRNVAEEVSRLCACFNLRKLSRAVTQIYDDALRPIGIRSGQSSILMALNAHEQCTIHQLSQILCVDRTSLSRNLKPLSRRGLIVIRPGMHDKRTRLLRLSPEGHQKLLEAYPCWEQAQRKITELLGKDGLNNLVSELNEALGKLQQEFNPDNEAESDVA